MAASTKLQFKMDKVPVVDSSDSTDCQSSVHRLLELDPLNEHPYLYFISHPTHDYNVLIDTGVGAEGTLYGR